MGACRRVGNRNVNESKDIGREFPLSAEIIEAQTRQIETRTRRTLALGLSLIGFAALMSSGAYSYVTGNLTLFLSVWSVLAIPLGAVFAHYFGKNGRNDQNDDTGAA